MKAAARKGTVSKVPYSDEIEDIGEVRWEPGNDHPAYIAYLNRKVALPPKDAKLLARLVKTYGKDRIARAMEVVTHRGPGRPAKGYLARYQQMLFAESIELRADEYRASGSRKPYTDVYLEIFNNNYSADQARAEGAFERFQKAIKKQHYQGRMTLRQASSVHSKKGRK